MLSATCLNMQGYTSTNPSQMYNIECGTCRNETIYSRFVGYGSVTRSLFFPCRSLADSKSSHPTNNQRSALALRTGWEPSGDR
jgi:hypothetical protein